MTRPCVPCETCGSLFKPHVRQNAPMPRFCSRVCFGAHLTQNAVAKMASGRVCARCKVHKPIDAFWPDMSKRTGRAYWCRDCALEHRRGDGHDAHVRYERSEKGRTSSCRRLKIQRSNQIVYAAHKAVQVAIQNGTLVAQPCEVCGATQRVHGHHDDYMRALDVRWLCPLHHRRHHADIARSRRESDS